MSPALESHYDCILHLLGTSQFAMCFLLHFILYRTVGKQAQQVVLSHLIVEATEARRGEETWLQAEAGI